MAEPGGRSIALSEAGRRSVLVLAGVLFGLIFATRFAVGTTADSITLLYVVPVALLGAELGRKGGIGGAAVAYALFLAWALSTGPEISVFGYASRAAAFFLVGGLTGGMASSVGAAAAEWEALVQAAPDGIVRIDVDGRIAVVNRQAEEMFGYDEGELLGQPLELVVPPRARLMGAGDYLRAVRRDGSEFPVEISLSQSMGDEGVLVTAIVRDVTERIRAQDQERLQSLIAEQLSEGLCLIRAEDERIVWVNPSFCAIYGWTPEELEGRPISTLVAPGATPEDREAAREARERLGDRKEVDFETRTVRRDGRELWCRVQARYFDHPEHGPVWVAVHEDVTERRRVEEEREEAHRELERSNAALEEFAYAASHDLGEPLRVLEGALGFLQKRHAADLGEDGARFIGMSMSSVDRLQAMIDALLLFARVGSSGVEFEPVDTSRVAHEAVDDLRSMVADRGATVTIEELPVVLGEPNLLRQVFQNLISNAIKFGDDERPSVRVSAEGGDDCWHFSVADNGQGVAPPQRERIFEVFQRLHGRDVPGTGIGLAICRRVVQLHGGSIQIDTADTGGSVFTFAIPAELPAAETTEGPAKRGALLTTE